MKAVILAAGEGTRLRPITNYMPKPMLPFYGKPFMEYTLENLTELVESVVIVVNYRQEQIRDYFGDRFASLPLEYVVQQDMRGTGAAVMAAKENVGGKFLIIQGDVYASQKLLQNMVSMDDEYVLSLVEVDDSENHAGMKHQDGKVREVLVPDRWVDRGVWILSLGIFDKLGEMIYSEDTGEIRMLNAIQKLIDEGTDVKAYLTNESWIQLGDHAPLESVLKGLKFFKDGDSFINASIASDIEVENSNIVNSLIFGSGKIESSKIENSVVYLNGAIEGKDMANCMDVFDSEEK